VRSDLDERDERIARRAEELVFQRVYAEIGRSVVKRVFWLALMVLGGLLSVWGYFGFPGKGGSP
jgi:hypothetical protein